MLIGSARNMQRHSYIVIQERASRAMQATTSSRRGRNLKHKHRPRSLERG